MDIYVCYSLFCYINIHLYFIGASSCSIFSENQCSGDTIITDETFEDHRWFTPSPGDEDYIKSFQDFYALAGHVHLVYDSSRSTATVEIVTSQRDETTVLSFKFNDAEQLSNTKTFTKESDKGPVTVSIVGNSGELKIDLDPIDFIWSNPDVVTQNGD